MTQESRADQAFTARRVWDIVRLKPYGDSLLTPAVRVWVGFAWTIILLMATLEGLVWGLVGASLVPKDSAWIKPISGLLLFALIFSVIWIIDASLVMSERPMIRRRRWSSHANQGFLALVRWLFGFLARLAIVALSLYVTAPFLAKLIRADDIAHYHQRQVEQYYAERTAQLKAQIAERTAQMEQNHRARTELLTREIERLTESIERERQRRTEIEAEFAPELEILRRDLAAAQQRVGDEILGRDGRPAGRGPEARKWEANAQRLADQLALKQSELDARVSTIDQRLSDWERTLRERTQTLQQLGEEYQRRLDDIATEVAAQQPEPNPPRLTFAARSKALQALRHSPEERGVPHFETVEGFAQATLGVLFLSLIALKLFEPTAVRAYFSETLQMQYRTYLEGGLDAIPGFGPLDANGRRLNPVEFTRLWLAYDKDPAAFFAERQALIEVREPLLRYLAERELERDRLVQRRLNLEDELLFARRRRERELAALERELELRTTQLQAQLADETKTIKDQRRIQLAIELQKARQDWNLRRLHEEEQLRRERERLEQEHRQALETIRLREQEIAHAYERSQARLRHSELATQLEHQRKLAELEQRRQHENRKLLVNAVREELTRLRALETKQRAERQSLREGVRKLEEELTATRSEIAVSEIELAELRQRASQLRGQLTWYQSAGKSAKETPQRRLWPGQGRTAEGRSAGEIERELKAVERSECAESERLVKLNNTLSLLERRLEAIAGEQREAEMRLAATEARLQFHEDNLATLLAPQSLAKT
ncbi:MAG: hypothetical protein ACUVQI_10235 [Thermochromatium sp.]